MPDDNKSVVGKRIPDEVLDAPLTNQDGEETTLKKILASLDPKYHGIAMFMFPAVGTPHCSKQACGFQTLRQDFRKLGYDLYGFTTYSDRAKVWCQRHNLGYPILGTKDWALVKYLGCTYFRILINRSHLVISRDAVVKALEVGVKAEMSSRALLDIIKHLK